jgi:DICT domain-containing protein
VGGAGARERLRELCEDGDDNVRYNAALGLARLGDTFAWETLAEMLTLPDVAMRPDDPRSQADRYRRAMIVANALKGVGLLVDDNAEAEPPPADIMKAIEGLRDDAIGDVQQGAKALLKRIDRLTTPTS